MTVYIDDARIPATVGRWTARWSHLTADTKDELHEFADRLGLRRAWFQDKPNGAWHYDVSDEVRARAILLGATQVTWERLSEICFGTPEREGRRRRP